MTPLKVFLSNCIKMCMLTLKTFKPGSNVFAAGHSNKQSFTVKRATKFCYIHAFQIHIPSDYSEA